MNLHKAKGLEADVVFLADPFGGMKPRVDVHIERKGDRALGWFKVEKKSEGSFAAKLLGEHADWDAARGRRGAVSAGRGDRLLYVAATRAREHARRQPLMPEGHRRGAFSTAALAQRQGAASSGRGQCRCARCRPSASVEAQAEAQTLPASLPHARVNQPSWSITSVTAEAKHLAEACPRQRPPRRTTRPGWWRRTRQAIARMRAWRGGR